jgi:hypothetical protein
MAMDEAERILHDLGYFDSDPAKKQQIQGYIDEAKEYMLEAGVPQDKLDSQRAYAVKCLWANGRDKGDENSIITGDGMLTNLIVQMRR